MPTFQTKTIEAILEPVAQQVSKLVILHEEAEDGNPIPDLTNPVQAVKKAVDNLVKVGYETVNISDDDVLKHDMPPALIRVEQSSMLLVDAASMLLQDPRSSSARKKLIDGSRGILQGTSALLMAFDESEVRKIIRKCNTVLEYLAITEVICSIEDLVKFIENLSPNMTSMIKSVEIREKELTCQTHRDMLVHSVNEIRQDMNLFVNSLKMYVNIKSQGQYGLENALHNRNYVVNKMNNEISEIIRVLRLTSDEDDYEYNDPSSLKAMHILMKGKMKSAIDWIQDVTAMGGGSGEHALRQLLETAKLLTDKSANSKEKLNVSKIIGDIDSLTNTACELRQQRKGDTPQGLALVKSIKDKLMELDRAVDKIILNVDTSGGQRIDSTLTGKLDQAIRWTANPILDNENFGEKAAKQFVIDSRKLIEILTGAERSDFLKNCDEIDSLTNELSHLLCNGNENSEYVQQLAVELANSLKKLDERTKDAIARMVAENFMDTTNALKHLSESAKKPLTEPGRNESLKIASNNFEELSKRLSKTANFVTLSASPTDKKLVQTINNYSTAIKLLTPEVVHAAKIVHCNPEDKTSLEHFEMIKGRWEEDVNKLKSSVDSIMDTLAFIEANKIAIKMETECVENAISEDDGAGIIKNTYRIGKRTNRVIEVAQQEVENSEDPQLISDVGLCITSLRNILPEMVKGAKLVVNDTKNFKTVQNWHSTNDKLVEAINNVGVSIRRGMPSRMENEPSVQFKRMNFDESAPPRPPLPNNSAPPRPPPPSDTEEDEPVFPVEKPQENQPIMQAAHALHMDVKQWSSRDNDLIAAAKQMAVLMANLSQLVRGEGGSKKDLIATAKAIAEASERVTLLAKQLAAECTDKRMRMTLLQVCERIPTIGTQLKILSTVKATMLGAQGSDEDEEATEMLVGNAQNLMLSVRDTVRAAEAASIKIRIDSGYSISWQRKRPWYT